MRRYDSVGLLAGTCYTLGGLNFDRVELCSGYTMLAEDMSCWYSKRFKR